MKLLYLVSGIHAWYTNSWPENVIAELRCADHEFLRINAAYFGTNCTPDPINATPEVKQECGGKSNCRFKFTRAVGDPCPGWATEGGIAWRCEPREVIPEPNFYRVRTGVIFYGEESTLKCPNQKLIRTVKVQHGGNCNAQPELQNEWLGDQCDGLNECTFTYDLPNNCPDASIEPEMQVSYQCYDEICPWPYEHDADFQCTEFNIDSGKCDEASVKPFVKNVGWRGGKAILDPIIFTKKKEPAIAAGGRLFLLNVKNSAKWDIRANPYTGFMMFNRKKCGAEFVSLVEDGTIQFEFFDYAAQYRYVGSFAKKSGSSSSLTVQFEKYHEITYPNDQTTKKDDFGTPKKDSIHMLITNVDKVEKWGTVGSINACLFSGIIGVSVGHTSTDISACVAYEKSVWP